MKKLIMLLIAANLTSVCLARGIIVHGKHDDSNKNLDEIKDTIVK